MDNEQLKKWAEAALLGQQAIAALLDKIEAARKILEPLRDCDSEIRVWLGEPAFTGRSINRGVQCACDKIAVAGKHGCCAITVDHERGWQTRHTYMQCVERPKNGERIIVTTTRPHE